MRSKSRYCSLTVFVLALELFITPLLLFAKTTTSDHDPNTDQIVGTSWIALLLKAKVFNMPQTALAVTARACKTSDQINQTNVNPNFACNSESYKSK